MYECMYVVNRFITREPLDVEKGNEHSKVCDCLDCGVGMLNLFLCQVGSAGSQESCFFMPELLA